MKISRDEFVKRLQANELHLALVGMSNSGKSTCTNLLAGESGFSFFEVDEAINRELNIETMEQAAAWMGYPFEEAYPENKKRYLELEESLTRVEIPQQCNFVLDTTGSIIYGTEPLRKWIQTHFLVVGLQVSAALCEVLIADYFHRPKTVIWGEEFHPLPDEDGIEAMKRCYPALLNNRAMLYTDLADVQVPAELARSPDLTAAELLEAIQQELE